MTRRKGGYVLLDLVTGLMLVGVFTVALTYAVVRQNRAAERLAESRAATTIAEETLSRLQRGLALQPPDSVKFAVHAVPDATAVGERVWVEVSVGQGHRTTTLTGLVPRRSLDNWQAGNAAKGAQ